GPFKEPVDPVADNVPDYFEKVTKPMNLSTMKNKMDRGLYNSDEEFLADMNQIFTNC
ncbi:Bromodomain-containing protein, partial [Diaporthe sp. PMI_573]